MFHLFHLWSSSFFLDWSSLLLENHDSRWYRRSCFLSAWRNCVGMEHMTYQRGCRQLWVQIFWLNLDLISIGVDCYQSLAFSCCFCCCSRLVSLGFCCLVQLMNQHCSCCQHLCYLRVRSSHWHLQNQMLVALLVHLSTLHDFVSQYDAHSQYLPAPNPLLHPSSTCVVWLHFDQSTIAQVSLNYQYSSSFSSFCLSSSLLLTMEKLDQLVLRLFQFLGCYLLLFLADYSKLSIIIYYLIFFQLSW